MNKKGKSGFINHTGEYGASSDLFNCHDIHFFENIEEGIYSTVKVLIDNGFYTCSSCQGHIGFNEMRTVTIQGERTDIFFIQFLIWNINQAHKDFCIKYIIMPVTDDNNIYKGMFIKPTKIQILFGNCKFKRTVKAQRIFEKSIEMHHKINVPYNELWEMYAEDENLHIDIMF